MSKPTEENCQMINQKLDFVVPITESTQAEGSDEFFIRGVAINETTTRNGTKFISEELQKSAHSLRNKPILKDHINSVDSIVGRTTQNVNFNQDTKAIDFEAKIVDEGIKKKIEQGLINSVSVGAMVREVEKQESEDGDESTLVRGIDFVELSLVAVPADPNAGFAAKLEMALDLEQPIKENTEDVIMAEEIKQELTKLEELRQESAKLEEELEQLKIEKLKAQKEALMVKEEAEEESSEEEVAEEPAAEEAEAEAPAEDETKGEVESEDDSEGEVAEESFTLERSDLGGYAYSKDYTKKESLFRLNRRNE
jgi:hypothetical protein